jgi:hypothetical protein
MKRADKLGRARADRGRAELAAGKGGAARHATKAQTEIPLEDLVGYRS